MIILTTGVYNTVPSWIGPDPHAVPLRSGRWRSADRLERCPAAGITTVSNITRAHDLKWLPAITILVPEHARPCGGHRLQKLFSH
jgi:hypothetical protein